MKRTAILVLQAAILALTLWACYAIWGITGLVVGAASLLIAWGWRAVYRYLYRVSGTYFRKKGA